ncbi:THO complex subunit 2-like [Hordeum vulgare]|nr:THO complex subunit 2-like [Hordeum vulgare]
MVADTLASYAHLLPNDNEAFEHFGFFVSRKIDEATKIGKINLAATGKDLMDDEKQEIAIVLYTSLEMENDIIDERAPELEKNQKLGVLLGFLSVHDWDHAQLLLERLVQINPFKHIEIYDALFSVLSSGKDKATRELQTSSSHLNKIHNIRCWMNQSGFFDQQ